MGEVPDWYMLGRAAKFWGVAPWELANQPVIWREWALQAERSEHYAHNEKSRHKK